MGEGFPPANRFLANRFIAGRLFADSFLAPF